VTVSLARRAVAVAFHGSPPLGAVSLGQGSSFDARSAEMGHHVE
jgi:hypothetical protein